jgi:hypothetical protein
MSIENFKGDLDKLEICFIVNESGDILIEDRKLIFEYCAFKDFCDAASGLHRTHHKVKQEKYLAEGYKFYVIFEDEYMNKKDIVISRVRNLLGKNEGEKVFARKCVIREIPTRRSSDFVNKFHIQGNGGSRVKLGLFKKDSDELISVMTFGVLSRAKGNKIRTEGNFELIRFCTDSKYRCIGAAGKLMSYFEKNYEWTTILTFADKRWSPTGNLYRQIGFELEKITDPNYFYLKVPGFTNRVHRFAFRRDVLRLRAAKETDLGVEKINTMTEFALAQALGFDRIFDCGNFKFMKYKEASCQKN